MDGSAYCAININRVNFPCLESSSIQSRIALQRSCRSFSNEIKGNGMSTCYRLIYNLLLDQFEHFFLWKVARSSTRTDSPFFCINQLINGGKLISVIT
ncbi:hypothetical protein GGQ60_002185 [Pedobacter zeae]|uniref:Uncharacterized protein n=1 Tax=Pedobacter zeae TaxID=1737356 RepID=A0A7W6P6S1_9SPHI|nr:hypothetical protein [Pedobacter zeae]